MKIGKYIGLTGSLLLTVPATAQITTLDDLNNAFGYVIQRMTTENTGNGILYGASDRMVWVASNPEDNDNRYWAIYTSPQSGLRYIYNLGQKTFMVLNDNGSMLQDDATFMTLFPSATSNCWMILNNSRMAGLDTENNEVLIYNEKDIPIEKISFSFTQTNRKLSESELQEITQKVEQQENDLRTELLQRIEKFLIEAKENEEKAFPGFAGLYDYKDLEQAYKQEVDYSNAELEKLLEEAQQSIFPQENKYYRLFNTTRPNKDDFTENVLSVVDDPNVAGSMNLKGTPDGNKRPGTRKGTALESLSLFQFTATGSPNIFYLSNPGIGVYAGGENSYGAHLPLVDNRTYAVPYELIYEGLQKFRFRNYHYPQYYLTLNGDNNAVSYDQLEDPELWYLEEVQNIEVEIGATGYASLCLPCPIELPEEIEAYVATELKDNQLILKKLQEFTRNNYVLPAFTPVILKTNEENAGTVYECPISEKQLPAVESILKGVTQHTTLPTSSYILGSGSQGVGFYPVADDDRILASNRVYLPGTNINPQKQLVMRFEGATTEIRDPKQDKQEHIWYDLNGKRKTKSQKGIFISEKGIKKIIK